MSDVCPKTGLVSYASRAKAREAADGQRTSGRPGMSGRWRNYLCDHCKQWHNTRQSGRTQRRERPG